jgi:integrase
LTLALEWDHVRAKTLLIEQKNVDGRILTGQKTRRPPRTVDLLAAVRQDLAEYRLASGHPREGLVFPRSDRQPWREHDWRNWRRRVYQPAARALGVESPRPYDLRHSFASLRIHEGKLSIVELAEQMGHSTQTLLSTYAHVIAELRGQPKVGADAQIARARKRLQRRAG